MQGQTPLVSHSPLNYSTKLFWLPHVQIISAISKIKFILFISYPPSQSLYKNKNPFGVLNNPVATWEAGAQSRWAAHVSMSLQDKGPCLEEGQLIQIFQHSTKITCLGQLEVHTGWGLSEENIRPVLSATGRGAGALWQGRTTEPDTKLHAGKQRPTRFP